MTDKDLFKLAYHFYPLRIHPLRFELRLLVRTNTRPVPSSVQYENETVKGKALDDVFVKFVQSNCSFWSTGHMVRFKA